MWGDWKLGKCSVSCGNGRLVHTRKCNKPTPANGGKHCVGPSRKVQPCYQGCCLGTK